MRTTIMIILAFAVLFGCSAFISHKVNQTAELMEEGLQKAEVLIQQDRWEEAAKEINGTFAGWPKTKKWWAIVVNHNALNNVEISYQRLIRLILSREKPLSLSEIGTLIVLIKDIPEAESLKLINIF